MVGKVIEVAVGGLGFEFRVCTPALPLTDCEPEKVTQSWYRVVLIKETVPSRDTEAIFY